MDENTLTELGLECGVNMFDEAVLRLKKTYNCSLYQSYYYSFVDFINFVLLISLFVFKKMKPNLLKAP